MGRMTRAKAAEVAEKMHIDEDAVLDLPSDAIDPATPSKSDRPALGELEPNSAGSAHTDIDLPTDLKKSARSKKVDSDTRASETSASAESLLASTLPEVMPDEVDVAGSPASRAASDDLAKDVPECELLFSAYRRLLKVT